MMTPRRWLRRRRLDFSETIPLRQTRLLPVRAGAAPAPPSTRPPGFRAPRLTVAQAAALGLPMSRVGDLVALDPVERAPCQNCWHSRLAHSADAEDDYMCLGATCACPGWDPYLDD
jgi:hypothetical protein